MNGAAWNLFLKDQRVLAPWLAMWFGAQCINVVLCYIDWASVGVSVPGWNEVRHLMLFAGPLVLIMLIHEEPVAEGLDFWKTRPLRPRDILLGKALSLGLHFLLLPFLFKWLLLALTGHAGYFHLAFIEWAGVYLPLMLGVAALASVTTSLSGCVRLGVVGGLVVLLLGAVIEVIKAHYHWTPELTPWWDGVTRRHLVAVLACVVATGILLSQYLIGVTRLNSA